MQEKIEELKDMIENNGTLSVSKIRQCSKDIAALAIELHCGETLQAALNISAAIGDYASHLDNTFDCGH